MAVAAVLHLARCLQIDDKNQKAVQGDSVAIVDEAYSMWLSTL
jgi:hypothetical protein